MYVAQASKLALGMYDVTPLNQRLQELRTIPHQEVLDILF